MHTFTHTHTHTNACAQVCTSFLATLKIQGFYGNEFREASIKKISVGFSLLSGVVDLQLQFKLLGRSYFLCLSVRL